MRSLTSISSQIWPFVSRPDFSAHVESAFADACNLVTPNGNALALVSAAVGNGPLNAVLNDPTPLALVAAGEQLAGDGSTLTLSSGWRWRLDPALHWNPYPPYAHLAAFPETVAANVRWLRRALPLEAPTGSLAAAANATQGAFGSRPSVALVQMHAGELIAGLLAAHEQADLPWLHSHATQLAGLGPGLTPAGDDWLAGWLVGLRAVEAMDTRPRLHRLPVETVAATVITAARGRTSRLSLAFLQSAADGAVSEAWHGLLAALADASQRLIRHAAKQVMAYGATSGSDMLAGFVAAFTAPAR